MTQHYFGSRTVSAQEKNHLVQGVFARVAQRYDLMNDLMSLGQHRCWKKHFVDMIPLVPSMTILDVAGGTGDIALSLRKKAQELGHQDTAITVLDRNEAMVRKGEENAINQGVLDLAWLVADGENLPFASETFDLYTISFGIRNVTHRDKALGEAARVLKKGGIFACMEFSHANHPLIDKMIKTYQKCVIPSLGAWVAKDRASYAYLVESIEKFPKKEAFSQEIRESGMRVLSEISLAQGGVAIHMAVKEG